MRQKSLVAYPSSTASRCFFTFSLAKSPPGETFVDQEATYGEPAMQPDPMQPKRFEARGNQEGFEMERLGGIQMRNWCAALAIGALLALPLCAQQKSGSSKDDSASSSSPSEKAGAENTAPARVTIGILENHLADPPAPRPAPLPRPGAAKDTRAPGQLVPRYEFSSMYYYLNASPGDPFSGFSGHGGGGRDRAAASPVLG